MVVKNEIFKEIKSSLETSPLPPSQLDNITSLIVSNRSPEEVLEFSHNFPHVIHELREKITALQDIKSLNIDKCDPELLDSFILYVISYSQDISFSDTDKIARRCIDLYSLAFQWFCLGDFVNYKIPSKLKKIEFKRKNAYLSVLVKYYGFCVDFKNPHKHFLRYSEYGSYSGEHLAIYRSMEEC